MKFFIYIIFSMGLITITCPLVAQQNESLILKDSMLELNQIKTIGTWQGDSVILRWSPNNVAFFYGIIYKGFQVERYQMLETGLPDLTSVKKWNVKAFSKEKSKRICLENEDNKYLWTAVNSLYGEWLAEKNPVGFLSSKQEQDNKYIFAMLSCDLDIMASSALGLRMIDDDVDPKNEYLYRVVSKDSTIINTNGRIIIPKRDTINHQPYISGVFEEEGYVTLQWQRQFHEEKYSAYIIEQSVDGKEYTTVNKDFFLGGQTKELPSPVFSYRINVNNYQPHYYRIIGITPFGTKSNCSKSVKAMGRDKTAPKATSRVQLSWVEDTIPVIKWERVEDEDLEGFVVYKAHKFAGSYYPISDVLDSDQLSYTDITFGDRFETFYKIMAKDTAGNTSSSYAVAARIRDTIPPAKPTGLIAQIDTIGKNAIVTIKWNLGIEKDLYAYNLFFANDNKHFFTSITAHPITDTVFVDTIALRTLTEEVFYRVSAIDFNYNNSGFSEILEVERPDIVAPSSPVFYSKKIVNDEILLSWYNSASSDVIKNTIYRKEGTQEWELVATLKPKITAYTDNGIQKDKIYTYKIIATDDAGLESKSAFEYAIDNVETKHLSQPVAPLLQFMDEKGLIQISIQENKENRVYSIHRSVDNKQFIVVGNVGIKKNIFEDRRIKKHQKYYYKIRAIHDDGRKSQFSDVKSINMKI